MVVMAVTEGGGRGFLTGVRTRESSRRSCGESCLRFRAEPVVSDISDSRESANPMGNPLFGIRGVDTSGLPRKVQLSGLNDESSTDGVHLRGS